MKTLSREKPACFRDVATIRATSLFAGVAAKNALSTKHHSPPQDPDDWRPAESMFI